MPYGRIFLCGYHEAYIKHHMVMNVFFKLINQPTHKNHTFIANNNYCSTPLTVMKIQVKTTMNQSKVANSRDPCILFFTETFPIAEWSGQSHHPSEDERIRTIYTIEYCSATENKTVYLDGRCIEMEIISTEIRQTQKSNECTAFFHNEI